MEFFIDVEDDPPAITGIKEWCGQQIGEHIFEAVSSSNCYIQVEENTPLIVKFVTQVSFDDGDGISDLIHKEFDLSVAIRKHLDACGDFDAMKASIQNLLKIFDEYEEDSA